METAIGITGAIFMSLFFAVLYLVRPIKEIENAEEDEEEFNGMRLSCELDDEIRNISKSLDEYLLNRCFGRASYFNRKSADISDLNHVMFELALDNRVFKELEKEKIS